MNHIIAKPTAEDLETAMSDMPPRPDGMLNVTAAEVEAARLAAGDVELVRSDGTLTRAGQLHVANARRMAVSA